MLEIVFLPYMAVSLAIGWAIFSPFSVLENLDSLSFAKLETIDLISCFVPLSILSSIATIVVPYSADTAMLLASIFTMCTLFTALSLTVGLFLIQKMQRRSPMKRMAINGVVVPFGILMTIAWIAIPIWAFSYSTLYSMPATLAVAVATFMIRQLCVWACRENPQAI